MRRGDRQIVMEFRSHGGRRAGAGRKPASQRPPVHHVRRPSLSAHCPSHVTLRVQRGVPSLRDRRFIAEFRASLREAYERDDFRVCHYSIQRDHLHMLVEAAHKEALARGLKSVAARFARPLLRLVHGWLSKPITVSVSPSRFTFTRGDHTVELETKVFISTVSGKVIGVGRGVALNEPFEQVMLFDGTTASARGYSKFAVLEAFVRYGITICSNSTVMLRPIVTFVGSETLASTMGGYQEHLLAAAAITAGALECRFERLV